jgi:hypothetical protein
MTPDPSEDERDSPSETDTTDQLSLPGQQSRSTLAENDGPSADHLCYRHAEPTYSGEFLDSEQQLFRLQTNGCERCGTPIEVVLRQSQVLIDGEPQPPDEYDPSDFVVLGTALSLPRRGDVVGVEALSFDVPSVPRDHPLGERRVLVQYTYDATIVDGHAIDERDGRKLRYLVNDAPEQSPAYMTSEAEDGASAAVGEDRPETNDTGEDSKQAAEGNPAPQDTEPDEADVPEHLFKAESE